MTFDKFKDALKGVTLGDKVVPKNEQLLPLANLALLEVVNISKPLELVSNDMDDTPLYFLDEIYFIRKPNEIIDDESIIDIDDSLVMAVIYATAVFFVKDKAFALTMRDNIINNYNWNKYNTVACDGVDDEC